MLAFLPSEASEYPKIRDENCGSRASIRRQECVRLCYKIVCCISTYISIAVHTDADHIYEKRSRSSRLVVILRPAPGRCISHRSAGTGKGLFFFTGDETHRDRISATRLLAGVPNFKGAPHVRDRLDPVKSPPPRSPISRHSFVCSKRKTSSPSSNEPRFTLPTGGKRREEIWNGER